MLFAIPTLTQTSNAQKQKTPKIKIGEVTKIAYMVDGYILCKFISLSTGKVVYADFGDQFNVVNKTSKDVIIKVTKNRIDGNDHLKKGSYYKISTKDYLSMIQINRDNTLLNKYKR